MVSSWIEVGWVHEFTVVISGVQISLSGFTNLNEVFNSLSVGEVLVQIVLKMLDEIHMVLDEVISSHSWECEGVIIELPSVNTESWVFAIFKKFIVDMHGVIVVSFIKLSREEVQLDI